MLDWWVSHWCQNRFRCQFRSFAVPPMTCLASRTHPPWPVVNTYRGCLMVKLHGKNQGKSRQQTYDTYGRLWAFKWEYDVVAIYCTRQHTVIESYRKVMIMPPWIWESEHRQSKIRTSWGHDRLARVHDAFWAWHMWLQLITSRLVKIVSSPTTNFAHPNCLTKPKLQEIVRISAEFSLAEASQSEWQKQSIRRCGCQRVILWNWLRQLLTRPHWHHMATL